MWVKTVEKDRDKKSMAVYLLDTKITEVVTVTRCLGSYLEISQERL